MSASVLETQQLSQEGITYVGASGAPLLSVDGLKKSFGGQVVLEDLTVNLHRGEIVLLRGDNGSGKTTLLNILTGNLRPDKGVINLSDGRRKESFRFPRSWWRQFNPFEHFTPERVAREGVGRTWQDIRLFSTQNLLDNVTTATPRQWGENPLWLFLQPFKVRKQEREAQTRAKAALGKVGLKGREQSSADMISLGQSKRAAIARAIQAGAHVLFLDEPLAGLDRAGTREVITLLRDIARQEELTLVIVEHVFNIPLILDVASTVWTLKDRKLKVEDPETVRAEVGRKSDYGLHVWLRNIAGPAREIETQKLQGGVVLSKLIGGDVLHNDPVLEVKDLIVHRGNRLVIGERTPEGNVRGLSFTIRRGEIGLLEAPNGWGKTTLLEAIAGLLPVSGGSIRVNGHNVTRLPTWERVRAGVTLLQSRNNTFPALSVEESLRLSGSVTIPNELLRFKQRRMGDLSGGEKQKVAAACALSGRHFVLGLLDEPFSALDRNTTDRLMKSLPDLLQQSGLLLAVPHGHGDIHDHQN